MNATPLQHLERKPGQGELIKPEPRPRIEINIREAVPGDDRDFAFIDDLQKQASKSVGFLFKSAIEKRIADGDVLIAETPPAMTSDGQPIPGVRGRPLGYIIGTDRYMKHENVGIIYQVNVAPGTKRKLVGAMLVKAMFEKSAWGCKLFCCWCRQDLDANYFWESLGFVPLAFRTGSARTAGKAPGAGAIHIFWQKRIREGDNETPYWIPSQTSGGAMQADRLVIPIPPGTHWSDAKPIVLPGVDPLVEEQPLALPEGESGKKRRPRTKRSKQSKSETTAGGLGGLRFAGSQSAESDSDDAARDDSGSTKEKRRSKSKKPKLKYHPKYIAAARELCARYLEEVHTGRLLPEAATDGGKYDVSRQLTHTGGTLPPSLGAGSVPLDGERLAQLPGVSMDDIIDAEFKVADDREDGDEKDQMRDAASGRVNATSGTMLA